MWIFGKSKKELLEEKRKELEEQCRILNDSEDLLSKFPIGKPFKYLGETVWVTEVKLHRIPEHAEKVAFYWGDWYRYRDTDYKSKVTIEYWDGNHTIRWYNLTYDQAITLLKEI